MNPALEAETSPARAPDRSPGSASHRTKFFVAGFLCVHVPIVAFVAYVAVESGSLPMTGALLALFVATGAGTAMLLWAMYRLFAPVMVMRETLRGAEGKLALQVRVARAEGELDAQRAMQRSLQASEARFRSLTALSSDWYWEMNQDLRMSYISAESEGKTARPVAMALGKLRWELDYDDLDEPKWLEHRAALEARRPFRDFEVRKRLSDGTLIHSSLSGEPVFDEQRRFAGYRGIGRDITGRKLAEDSLRESDARYRAVSESMLDGILILQKGRFMHANPAALRLLGYRLEELIGTEFAPLVHPEHRALVVERHRRRSAGETLEPRYDMQVLNRSGEAVWVQISNEAINWLQQPAVLTIISDITERKRSERELQRFRTALDLTGDAIYLVDCNTLAILDCNDGAWRALGYRREELVGSGVDLIVADRTREQIRAEYAKLASEDTGAMNFETLHRRKDGSVFPVEVNRRILRTAAGPILVGVTRDISERKRTEERLAYLAHFDTLTGLPNRDLLQDRLQQAVVHARRDKQQVGVLFIDLDRFKLVNDTLGHHLGDRLIAQVAERIAACLRAGDTVGRISGDEFAAVLSDLARPDDAALVARKILDSLDTPFDLEGHETYVSASIGIAVYPEDGEDAVALLKDADAAMYLAKQTGRDRYCFFTADLNERAVTKLRLTNDLRRAVERREFCLHYQPKVDLASGALAGFEALIRWQHPQRGLVPPLEFIPALEESGLIVQVGEWVIEEAAAQLRRWRDAGFALLPIAVNLSPRQFRNSDLAASIQRRVTAAGITPGLIELEITESFLMDKPKKAVRTLEALSAAGLRISIDDFGTGYSSLAYLTRFPLTALKIDRSFVRDLHTGDAATAVARAIIDMAHTLRLTVIAEGVETEAQASFLRAHGCEQGQGYLFARPAPAAEITARLQSMLEKSER